MVTPILKLPELPLLKIFKKMDRTDLCHLRMASKRIDLLAESKRFDIAYVSRTTPLMLYISEMTGMLEPEICCRIYKLKFEVELDFSDKLLHCPMGSHVAIEDPFKQISAFHFDAVYLAFQKRQIYSFDKEVDVRSQQIDFYKKEIIPLLKSLRLVCDRLYLQGFPPSTIEIVLPLIHFSRLHTDSKIVFKEVSTLPMFDCDELHMGTFFEKPPTLAPLFRNVKVGSIAVCVEEDVLQILADFLWEIRLNRMALGQLKLFTFRTFLIDLRGQQIPHEERFGLPSLVHLFSGTVNARYEKLVPQEVSIYKLFIANGGMAVIVKHWLDYEVHFVEDNRRETVLKAVFSKAFAYVPYDLSVFYDRFMAEEDEEKAFRDLLTLD